MLHRISVWVGVLVLGVCSVARAEQFVLVDVTYTHSEDTTNDSHYYVTLPADRPTDWTKPIDWSNGTVHLIVDVLTKPAGDAKTKMQVCFEGTPAYACTDQSPTYTKTGRVEWDSPFKNFWYGGEVDWSKGVKKVPLILKDDANNKPAGNPKYMPTDLHVQVTLVSPGAKFVPPAAGSGGTGGAPAAGTGGAGAGGGGAAGMAAGGRGGAGGSVDVPRAGTGGASATPMAGTGSGAAGTSAAAGGGTGGTAAAGRAGSGVAGATAGTTASAAGAAAPAPVAGTVGTTTNPQVADRSGDDAGGCRSAGRGANGAVSFALLLLGWAGVTRVRRGRNRRSSTRSG